MRLVETDQGPVQRLMILRAQHVEAKRLAGPRITLPAFQQFMHGDEVAGRLRHLLSLDLEKAVTHPDLRYDRRAVGGPRLRDLVLMMREDEIDAAAMDVEGLAEMRRRHRRTFYMPARPAGRRDAARRRP